jgi:pimeloyl-ACP methyl ester carboxylesterase
MHYRQTFLAAAIVAATVFVLEGRSHAQPHPEKAHEARAAMEPYSFEAMDGTVVAAQRGELWVPENRNDPDSRPIKLAFVRFPSTNANPGAPIVYLAGGPGGSGVDTARGGRFPLFMALRAVADVIAFDQRGTGWSNDIPRCDTGRAYPLAEPLTEARLIPFMREQAATCARFWKEAGIDLAGYNTWESAADLDALRAALGADKITLWGISYGTHLGLAALKRYPERIEKAVLASIEDLDETVKLPALTDAYFARVQEAIDADEKAASAYPDLVGLMHSVHEKLDAAPMILTVEVEGAGPTELAIGKLDLQMFVSRMVSDPPNISMLPALYVGLAAGEVGPLGQLMHDRMRKDFGRYAGGMSEAMDEASGITARRLELVRKQAQPSLLGYALNFPMPQLAGAYGVPDLGDEFRAPVVSAVPTLFLSGTLDGRTYPESAAETAARFSNATHVLIENSGHNLFMVSPEVTEVILAFLEGKPVARKRIVLPTPTFVY